MNRARVAFQFGRACAFAIIALVAFMSWYEHRQVVTALMGGLAVVSAWNLVVLTRAVDRNRGR